jgi:large subunit ribosomal protein L13
VVAAGRLPRRFDPDRQRPVFWAVAVLFRPATSNYTLFDRPRRLPKCHRSRGTRHHRDERRSTTVRTYSPKPAELTHEWHVIDATDVVLGRLAVQVATLLRGKHKATFAPHMDTGDFVIVVNADKVALSGNKRETKMAYRHSGYPGGLSTMSFGDLLAKDPRRAVEKAVWGMLPKNRLSRQLLKKLKVYSGPNHPHKAQQPQPFEIVQISQ